MEFPLSGKTVLVTREKTQAKKLTALLQDKGATVLEIPLLKISCKETVDNVEAIHQLDTFDWLFFTSVNGVQCFFSLLEQHNIQLPEVKIAVVGHKTEEVLHQYGYRAAIVPTIYNGETLIQEFLATYEEINNVLLVQGNLSRDVIAEGLKKANIPFQTIVVYDTVVNEDSQGELQQQLQTKELDYITFTSPSAVDAFVTFAGNRVPSKTKIVCIGTTTEEKANALGFVNTMSPEMFTIEAMVQIMCEKN